MTTGGLVAIGDSIVNGYSDSMAGVPSLSWAMWLAESQRLSFRKHSVGGATSTAIATHQLPLVVGRYDVAVFNMGTNDVLRGYDEATLRANAELVAQSLLGHAPKLLILGLLVPFGRLPGTPARCSRDAEAANRVLESVSDGVGATFVLPNLVGPRFMSADQVHPTALGHLAIADQTASAIGSDVRPSSLALNDGRGRLPVAYHLGWAGRFAKESARATIRSAIKR